MTGHSGEPRILGGPGQKAIPSPRFTMYPQGPLHSAIFGCLDRTLGDRITWRDAGGHLGNLWKEEVQNEIVAAVDSLLKE